MRVAVAGCLTRMAEQRRSPPPFFIVGCPRSGTTLVRNLLRSHPDLTIPAESHFMPSFFRAYGDPEDAREARRLAERILRTWWVQRWRLKLEPQDLEGCRSYRELVGRLYEAVADREDALRWGDKTPGYARHLSTLTAIFPGAQFVHVVRDGRDVALSLLRTGLGPRSVYTAARCWKDHVVAARRDGAPLGSQQFKEVRYEDLAARPELTMRELCDFLEVPFDQGVLRPTPIDWRTSPSTFGPRRAGHISDSELVRSNAGKWRQELPPREVEIFESVAGDVLEEYGYETTGCVRRVSGPQKAAAHARDRLLWTGYQLRRENKRVWVPTELQLARARVRAWFRTAGFKPRGRCARA